MTININNNGDQLNATTGVLKVAGTGALGLPSGTTAQRPGSPVNGYTRFNTTLNAIEAYSTSTGKWEIVSYFTISDAPTIGTATAIGATSATVTYTAPTNTGGTTITSYTAVASPGGQTGTVSTAGSGTITVTGLTTATNYTFTVYATNGAGNSVSSASSNSILTWSVPNAPTVGTPVTNGNAGQLNVPFTAPSYNGGTTILSYTAISTPGSFTGTVSQAGSGTITVTGLANNTSYTFVVYATNSVGNSANSSSSPSANTPTTPGTPTIGTASAQGSNTQNALVPYTAPVSNGGATITSYTAVASPGSLTGSLSTAGSGTITVGGLTFGSAYTFTVYATNAVGNGSSSSASNSVTIPNPTISTNTQTFNSAGTWTKPTVPNTITGITVYLIGGGGGGGSSGNNPGSGGAGGGYGFAGVMSANQLGTTESILVGAGATGQNGNGGGPTAGGSSGVSGKLFCNATSGGSSGTITNNLTLNSSFGAAGGSGGNPNVSSPANAGGQSTYGGGGGGGCSQNSSLGAGGGAATTALVSGVQGGAGGQGANYNGTPGAGSTYGGAGGGAYSNSVHGGNGANGIVRIDTTYY
jgi:hypothetical protein